MTRVGENKRAIVRQFIADKDGINLIILKGYRGSFDGIFIFSQMIE